MGASAGKEEVGAKIVSGGQSGYEIMSERVLFNQKTGQVNSIQLPIGITPHACECMAFVECQLVLAQWLFLPVKREKFSLNIS